TRRSSELARPLRLGRGRAGHQARDPPPPPGRRRARPPGHPRVHRRRAGCHRGGGPADRPAHRRAHADPGAAAAGDDPAGGARLRRRRRARRPAARLRVRDRVALRSARRPGRGRRRDRHGHRAAVRPGAVGRGRAAPALRARRGVAGGAGRLAAGPGGPRGDGGDAVHARSGRAGRVRPLAGAGRPPGRGTGGRAVAGRRYSRAAMAPRNVPFKMVSEFAPAGDQPAAIDALSEAVLNGERFVTLLGITGSGKSATIAWTIERVQKPTLVIAPNKSLAAQLASEFREFFPHNRVEYFVSYYDYYQPEAYIASTDTYIEKDSSINDEIDRLRHSATAALLTRRDVIVVASVSCIYGLGSPEEYRQNLLVVRQGEEVDQR